MAELIAELETLFEELGEKHHEAFRTDARRFRAYGWPSRPVPRTDRIK